MSRSTDCYCGGGPNTRHREAAFIRCTVKMYNHVFSAWLFLSAPIRGAAQGHIIQIKYIYIYTFPHIHNSVYLPKPRNRAFLLV